MKSIKFKGSNIAIAEDQEEFQTVHAHHNPVEGSVVYCFELSEEEKKTIAETGKLWFEQVTGNKAMQPISPTVEAEDVINYLTACLSDFLPKQIFDFLLIYEDHLTDYYESIFIFKPAEVDYEKAQYCAWGTKNGKSDWYISSMYFNCSKLDDDNFYGVKSILYIVLDSDKIDDGVKQVINNNNNNALNHQIHISSNDTSDKIQSVLNNHMQHVMLKHLR